MGAPTSTKMVQATEIANFLWSSTADWSTYRMFSRIRIRALSMAPERITGIWLRRGVVGGAACVMATVAESCVPAGTTTAGVGCGVGITAGFCGGTDWAAYRLGTSAEAMRADRKSVVEGKGVERGGRRRRRK